MATARQPPRPAPPLTRPRRPSLFHAEPAAAAVPGEPSWNIRRRTRNFARSPSLSAGRRGATPNPIAVQNGLNPITIETLYDAKPSTLRALTPPRSMLSLITLDNHMSAAVDDARKMLVARTFRTCVSPCTAATDWNDHPHKLQACKDDVARGNIIRRLDAVHRGARQGDRTGPWRRGASTCDAMMCCMSAGEIMKNTTMGRFKMDGEQKGPLALLKKLRGDSSKARKDTGRTAARTPDGDAQAGCRNFYALSPAPPRMCATTSSPCSTGSPHPT